MNDSDRSTALTVGAFLLLGIGCLAYLAVKMGDIGLWNDNRYVVSARFVSVSGLRPGARVELAGVPVGVVADITLDTALSQALVSMRIDDEVGLSDDTIASVRTAGIIGEKFVKLSPGGSSTTIPAGGEIYDTEPSISLEELISKYIFEGDKSKSN